MRPVTFITAAMWVMGTYMTTMTRINTRMAGPISLTTKKTGINLAFMCTAKRAVQVSCCQRCLPGHGSSASQKRLPFRRWRPCGGLRPTAFFDHRFPSRCSDPLTRRSLHGRSACHWLTHLGRSCCYAIEWSAAGARGAIPCTTQASPRSSFPDSCCPWAWPGHTMVMTTIALHRPTFPSRRMLPR